MGSYNKIGFHSGLPIMDNKEIVLFICSTKHFSMDNSPISVDELISPICLPLYGKYDGYGGIESVTEDANFILLQKLYNGDVYELLSTIQEYSCVSASVIGKLYKEKKEDKQLKLYLSFLKKIGLNHNSGLCTTIEIMDVYQGIINIINKPMLVVDKWDKGANIGDFWLSKLGFTKDGEKNYDAIYRYKDSPYYVSGRGYTPPSIMLDDKQVWHGYGGLNQFIEAFNEIANVSLSLEDNYATYSLVDASYESLKNMNDRDNMNHIRTKEEIKKLKERFKDNPSMLDFIKNKMGRFNMFQDEALNYKVNDVIPFKSLIGLMNRNNMCVYNNVNILTDDYKDIVCNFVKFNNALRSICGYYKFSSYAHQSINLFKEEFAELNKVYQRNIEELTCINEED